MAMVIVGPAVVISVVVMLGLMRRHMVLDHRTTVFLVNAVVVVRKVVFTPVDIPHVDFVDVPGGGVVEKLVPAPFATLKAVSRVAIAIADPAVVTDVRSPVAGVKAIVPAFPSPIGWRPEHAG
jgi:hypothetical protein